MTAAHQPGKADRFYRTLGTLGLGATAPLTVFFLLLLWVFGTAPAEAGRLQLLLTPILGLALAAFMAGSFLHMYRRRSTPPTLLQLGMVLALWALIIQSGWDVWREVF